MAKDRSGFTLIEVLVVLAILGITIPVFLTVVCIYSQPAIRGAAAYPGYAAGRAHL
ncbi:MAG: type II secretion system protein [Bacillota bacterium]